MFFYLRGLAVVLMVCAMVGPVGARSPARPVILLSCAAPAELCRTVIQTLARQSKGFVIRTVEADQISPPRPGDLGVRLDWQDRGNKGQRTRLSWRSYGADLNHIGPWFDLGAIELPLSPIRQNAIARGLVSSVPGLQIALRPK